MLTSPLATAAVTPVALQLIESVYPSLPRELFALLETSARTHTCVSMGAFVLRYNSWMAGENSAVQTIYSGGVQVMYRQGPYPERLTAPFFRAAPEFLRHRFSLSRPFAISTPQPVGHRNSPNRFALLESAHRGGIGSLLKYVLPDPYIQNVLTGPIIPRAKTPLL